MRGRPLSVAKPPTGPLSTATALPCWSATAWSGFDVGPKPGTFDACGIRNRLDYIFISKSLEPYWAGGGLFREGALGNTEVPNDCMGNLSRTSFSKQQSTGLGSRRRLAIQLNL